VNSGKKLYFVTCDRFRPFERQVWWVEPPHEANGREGLDLKVKTRAALTALTTETHRETRNTFLLVHVFVT